MTISVNRSALNALQTLARSNDPAAARTGAPQKAGQERGAPAVGSGPRPDVVSLAQLKRTLDRAASVADVALSAGQSVADILDQLRTQADSAEAGDQRSLQARLGAALRQIDHVVSKAGFDGINLLDGSLGEDLRITLDGGSELALPARDLRPGGAYVTLSEETTDPASALEASSVNVSSALADLRIQGRQIEAHTRFVSRLGEALVSDQNAGELTRDGARLQALMIQQQLAGGRAAIGNQAPQLVLQLFRS